MKILSVTVRDPRKPSFVASASVILEADGTTLAIHDFRILRNRQGVLWVAAPNYSVQQGRAWEYFPTVEPESQLGKRISEAVLAAFEKQQSAVKR